MQPVLESRPGERFDSAVWAPGGHAIVFTRANTDPALPAERRRPTLWRVDIPSGKAHLLPIDLEGPRDPSIAPDGRTLAFTAGYPVRQPWIAENFLPGGSRARERR